MLRKQVRALHLLLHREVREERKGREVEMTDQEIYALGIELERAIKTDDDKLAGEVAVKVFIGLLKDIGSIARSLAILATPKG